MLIHHLYRTRLQPMDQVLKQICSSMRSTRRWPESWKSSGTQKRLTRALSSFTTSCPSSLNSAWTTTCVIFQPISRTWSRLIWSSTKTNSLKLGQHLWQPRLRWIIGQTKINSISRCQDLLCHQLSRRIGQALAVLKAMINHHDSASKNLSQALPTSLHLDWDNLIQADHRPQLAQVPLVELASQTWMHPVIVSTHIRTNFPTWGRSSRLASQQ